MPYKTIAELPKPVRTALPEEAQRVYMNVVNSQIKRGLSEESAIASAWGALKNQGWKKQGNGKWKQDIKKAYGTIIALDFDGTVVKPAYPDIGEPIEGAIEWLKLLAMHGCKYILNTMRSGDKLDAAVKYLTDKGIRLYGINKNPAQAAWTDSPKVYADIYIDDKNAGAALARDEGNEELPWLDWERTGKHILEEIIEEVLEDLKPESVDTQLLERAVAELYKEGGDFVPLANGEKVLIKNFTLQDVHVPTDLAGEKDRKEKAEYPDAPMHGNALDCPQPICMFCDCEAEKALLWGGGQKVLYVCNGHIPTGLQYINDINNSQVSNVIDLENEEAGEMEDTPEGYVKIKITVAKADAPTKTEGGKNYGAGDYAYTPDKQKPSTWKLRMVETPGGDPSTKIIGASIAALGSGFRGNKVRIPAADLPAVKTKILAAWKKLHPDNKEIPNVLKSDLVHKELVVDIAKQDNEKQIIIGVAMEPSVDSQGDFAPAEEIEKAAHDFLLKSRVVGLQHKEAAPARVVESYIAQDEMMLGGQKVLKGSWIVAVKVDDPELWNAVKSGEYTGFSIGGYGIRKGLEDA